MKDIHITEIMSRKELKTISISDSLSRCSFVEDCGGTYVVNDENILKGRIDKRRLLAFMGPSLMIINGSSRKAFMERVRSLPMDDVMEYSPETLNLNSSFAEVLQKFETAEQESLPVIDRNGRLIGEISCSSVLDYLDGTLQTKETEILRVV